MVGFGNLNRRRLFCRNIVKAYKSIPLAEFIAEKHHRSGYRFVPLVREDFSLSCNIDVLLLRVDYPGSIWTAGDVDNRIKTLIDALRMPDSDDDLRGNENPATGEDPFFCLLQDDKLITGFRVETDRLLKAYDSNVLERRQVEIVVSVEIRPYVITHMSLGVA